MDKKEYKKIIQRFRRRINLEAGIRACSMGLAVGLFGAAAVLLYARIIKQELWTEAAGVLAVKLFVTSAILLYWLLLRPGKKEVLARIDALGLKERVITMEELKQVDTVMAKKQRQDTEEQLELLSPSRMGITLYIKPLLWCLLPAAVVVVLLVLPFPEPVVDEQAEQNAQEMLLVDELIAALKNIVEESKLQEGNKAELHEIIDALAMGFSPEDTTFSRTAKIATASKRLDMYVAAEQSDLTVKKQETEMSEEAKAELKALEAEQKLLEGTVKQMKDLMGTSIDVLNKVEGTFWTPGGPSSGTSYDVEPLPFEEEPVEGEEPPEGEEPGEGEEPPEGGEPPEDGEPQEGEGEDGEQNGNGGEMIFDPEQGEVGYGAVYEEYYQEILKALTETELSEEIREIIEDYANSLE